MIRLDDKIIFPTRSIDVLTVGELLVDMISAEYDDKHEGSSYHKYFGGSPSNIAMNTTRLGLRSLVSAAVGNDAFGNYLVNKLQDAGIDTHGVQRVDGSTSMVVINKSRSTPTPIFYRDADYQLAYTSLLEELVTQSKIVHFSCWPISKEPARQTIEQVLKVAKQHNVLIGFDPNYHPLVWQKGEDAVSYIESVISNVDIVKPSEDDAERLFGKDTPENHVKRFVELGAKLVVMTLGKDGALVSNGSDTVRFDATAEEIVDTTGAGDAFWSGFYAGLVKGHSVHKALTLGFAVSAYKLKYTGAVVNLPRLEHYVEMNGGE